MTFRLRTALAVCVALAFVDCTKNEPERRPWGTFPVVTITSPRDGAVLAATPVTVTGTVGVPALVTVNRVVARIDGLSFAAEVPLVEGENEITVTATANDAVMNTDTARIHVTLFTGTPGDLVITIDDAQPASDGVLELPFSGQSTVAVNGGYTPVRGPVEIVATATGQAPVTASGEGGRFGVSLPAVADVVWDLVVTETEFPNSQGSVQLRLVGAGGLVVTLDDVRPGSDGVPELLFSDQSTVAVNGGYTPARGPVEIVATATGQAPVTASGEGGRFGVSLPAVADVVWDLVVTETEFPNSQGSVQVRLVEAGDLVVTIDDARPGSDGVPEVTLSGLPTKAVTGGYVPARGPVEIVATAAGQAPMTSTSADGRFRVLLPAVADSVWDIVITETEIPNGQGSAQLRLVADTTPPVITITGGLQQVVDADLTVLMGTAVDQHSDVAEINIVNDRFGPESFVVIRGGNDSFYCEVPLARGDNQVAVTATDALGNAAAVVVQISRPIGLEPEVVITEPVSGTVTESPTIDVRGIVYTTQPPERARITLTDRFQFATPTARDGIYTFEFLGERLQPGTHELVVRVETPVGNAEASTWVTYATDTEPPDDMTPIIVVTSPRSGFVTGDPLVFVSGSIERGVGEVSLTINDEAAELRGPNRVFQHTTDISSQPAGDFPIVLRASDEQGNVGTATVMVVRDLSAPVITITSPGVQLAPAVTSVLETPFILEGTVTDDNLASVMINGQPIGVVPGAAADSFDFSEALALPNGVEQAVVVEARDQAGNVTRVNVLFLANVPVSIEIISPREGADLMVNGTAPTVSVVARLTGFVAGQTVTVQIDGGAPLDLAIDGNVAGGSVPLPGGDGSHEVVVEVRDAAGAVIARARAHFSSVNEDDLPLEVVRVEPENGARGVEPNAIVNIYFNKSIDPSLLQVTARETAHGLTYDLSGNRGADMLELSMPPLVEVNRDQEPVVGELALFPGNRMVSYHLGRDLAYGATAYVEVAYGGEVLVRFSFEVRSLPTFLQGLVADQLMEPVAGIEVSLGDVNLVAVTDNNGSFSFGFGTRADETLPAGRHAMVINQGLKNRRFGSRELWANVEEGRLTRLGSIILPLLNPDVPFRRVSGGAAAVVLADGDLVLDLGQASLVFPNGQSAGDVHVQFLKTGEAGVSSPRYAIPQWLFAVQPSGVEVTGQVGITFEAPPLYGGHDYLPAEGTLVMLVGFDARAMQLVAVGVGKIEGQRISSVRPVELTRLDYLGYAFVEGDGQGVLAQFESGAMDLMRVMAELDGLYQ